LDVANIQRTGQADIANINNTGQLTRQRLIEGTNYAKATNDYNADVFKTNADIFKTNADIFKTQAGFNVSSFNAATDRMNPKVETRSPGDDEIIKGIWADQSMTSDQKYAMTLNARASLSGGQSNQTGARQAGQPGISGRPSVLPDTLDDNKDISLGTAPKAGAQSMTFATNMGTAQDSDKKKRREALDSYNRFRSPGTRPFSGE